MANLYPYVVEMKVMLSNLDRWLGAAAEHVKSKKTDPDALVGARLAIDQYPLVKQVQSACDGAKFTAARLSGKEGSPRGAGIDARAPNNDRGECAPPGRQARSCSSLLPSSLQAHARLPRARRLLVRPSPRLRSRARARPRALARNQE